MVMLISIIAIPFRKNAEAHVLMTYIVEYKIVILHLSSDVFVPESFLKMLCLRSMLYIVDFYVAHLINTKLSKC